MKGVVRKSAQNTPFHKTSALTFCSKCLLIETKETESQTGNELPGQHLLLSYLVPTYVDYLVKAHGSVMTLVIVNIKSS